MDRPENQRTRIVLALKVLALALFLGLFGRALLHADLAGAWARIREIGPAVVLIALPFPLALALDAIAWKVLLARLGHRVSLARLFRVRVATESITTALPAGGIPSEAVGPFLVSPDAPYAASFTSSATKRWLIIRTHGYYVALAFALGFGTLAAASPALLHNPSLPWIVLGCAAALIAISIALESMASRLGLASRLHDALAKLKESRLLARLAIRDVPREAFEKVDADLARLGKAQNPVPAALILGAWILESVESFIILRVLGVDVGFITVLSFDAALSVVRTAAAFAPSGIGAQDLGYLAFFEAYGIPSPAAIGPAFLFLKRGNQLVWATIGFVLLLAARKRAKETETTKEAS